jgi:hypothetical protein
LPDPDDPLGPYCRLYLGIPDDPRFDGIYSDDAAWSAFTRLLMIAEGCYPAPGSIPRVVSEAGLEKCVAAGLVETRPGDRFVIHGLASERERRTKAASAAGRVSATGAVRVGGRFAPRTPPSDHHRTTNGPPTPVGLDHQPEVAGPFPAMHVPEEPWITFEAITSYPPQRLTAKVRGDLEDVTKRRGGDAVAKAMEDEAQTMPQPVAPVPLIYQTIGRLEPIVRQPTRPTAKGMKSEGGVASAFRRS